LILSRGGTTTLTVVTIFGEHHFNIVPRFHTCPSWLTGSFLISGEVGEWFKAAIKNGVRKKR
jgi:hypothetical protein